MLDRIVVNPATQETPAGSVKRRVYIRCGIASLPSALIGPTAVRRADQHVGDTQRRAPLRGRDHYRLCRGEFLVQLQLYVERIVEVVHGFKRSRTVARTVGRAARAKRHY